MDCPVSTPNNTAERKLQGRVRNSRRKRKPPELKINNLEIQEGNETTPVTDCKICDCSRNCGNLLTEDERLSVIKHFRELNDVNEQNAFIQRSVKQCGIQKGRGSEHNLCKYYLKTCRGNILVCKMYFANTFEVSLQRIDEVLSRKGRLRERLTYRNKNYPPQMPYNSKQYNLNWKKLFRQYVKNCKEKNLTPVNVSTFIYILINS